MPHVFDTLPLEQRPFLVAIAGPNGAGKTTFHRAFLAKLGLSYINADDIARALRLPAYSAAEAATFAREFCLASRESFIFETVFSDPEGDKVHFLERAVSEGYAVVLFFIGIASAALSDARVVQRVASGGHDVPPEKIRDRFPRVLANLERAVRDLPHVVVYDNSRLDTPFELLAVFNDGALSFKNDSPPAWATAVLRPVGA